MLDKLASIFFGDIPVDQRRFVTRLLFRGIFLVHIAWACGWLTSLGFTGFARAEEEL